MPADGAAMKTADPELMRAINRFHVMDAIRRFGPISRVEISEQTELSPTTVSAITAALLEDGLIVPRQVAPGSGPAARPSAHHARAQPGGGFGLRREAGSRQDHHRRHQFPGGRPRHGVDPDQGRPPARLGHPGSRRGRRPVAASRRGPAGREHQRPLPRRAGDGRARLGHLPLQPDLLASAISGSATTCRSASNVPTTVDSDVNLVTLAEHWFGHGRGLSDFLVVSIEHTIGLGIMHRGRALPRARTASAPTSAT